MASIRISRIFSAGQQTPRPILEYDLKGVASPTYAEHVDHEPLPNDDDTLDTRSDPTSPENAPLTPNPHNTDPSPARFRLSMRSTLGATVVLMGILGLVLALTTGEIYHRQALNSQRQALLKQVELATANQMQVIVNRSRDLALAWQSETGVRNAWPASGRELATELHRQLQQYGTTVRRLNVTAVAAYNSAGTIRAAATPEAPVAVNRVATCPVVTIPESREVVSGFCDSATGILHAVRVPVRFGDAAGYLEIVANPVTTLTHVAGRLGLPVRIRAEGNTELYASPDWPPASAMDNALVAEQKLTDRDGQVMLKVASMRDIRPLREELRKDRWLVFSIAAGVTILGVWVAFSFLERTALEPLNRLTEHLRRVSRDRNHLDETVNVGGIAEVRELADDFNHMARELSRLYDSLEHMAFTDPLTNLPNRARFRDSLDEAARRHAQAQTPFALLLMDLDRFKQVNDTLGHQVGDLLLQEVSVRLKGVLRGSDTIARLDNATILELDSKMVARLGGDEFAAILPRVGNMDDASGIARKLLLTMQEPFAIRDRTLSIGISIGVALYPKHGKDIEALIQRADAAMYYAKHNQTGLAFPETMQQTRLI